MDPRTFIFFGRSGSGKGTQAHLLADYLEKESDTKALYIETGARFREFKTGDSLSSKLAKEIIEHGDLMPEFLPIWIWSEILVKNYTGKEHLILDGLSRRLDEAPVLDSAMHFYKIKDPYVLYLNISRERARDLMKGRGRNDDTDEYIEHRLDWFEKDVVPAIEYFKENKYYKFIEINGQQSIEDVHKEIIEKISS